MIKLFLLTGLFFFFLFPRAIGQQPGKNLPGKENAIAFYRKMVKENSSLFTGRLFMGEGKQIQGHQFFETEEWTTGDVHYQGNLYQNVPLLYDLLNDQLILQHENGFLKIQVLKNELESFSFSNSIFVNLKMQDSAENIMSPGIYHQIYSGEIDVLVKRQKTIKETIEEMEIKREYEQSNRYFIVKRNVYYPFKRKGQLLNILKEHKKEVRKRLRDNKIKFRRDPEFAIVKMVEFYEQATE